MQQKTGAALEIKKILVHNMKKVRQGVDQNLLTDQWKEIIEDDEIQIVIEVMGGIEPAKTMITEALKAGKNVVSANKDMERNSMTLRKKVALISCLKQR